jgi:hypothetical protein
MSFMPMCTLRRSIAVPYNCHFGGNFIGPTVFTILSLLRVLLMLSINDNMAIVLTFIT